MSVNDGIILKGYCIVIPLTLRQPRTLLFTLNQLHYGHQGAEKCKLRAKGAVFWHGINSDIDKLVSGCSTCQANQPASSAEPLHPHAVPPRAWHTVASDLFHREQKDYLVVSDMYSKFPIVRHLHSTTASAVIIPVKGDIRRARSSRVIYVRQRSTIHGRRVQSSLLSTGLLKKQVRLTTRPPTVSSNGPFKR